METEAYFNQKEHILVCLSSSPSNAKIIHTASQMAEGFQGAFTALYVQTSSFDIKDAKSKQRLHENMELAQQLGAVIETVYGDDVPLMIAEFVRLAGVTKIVIGRSAEAKRRLIRKPSLSEQLLQHLPDMEIHIIPDQQIELSAYHSDIQEDIKKNSAAFVAIDISKSIGILTAVSLIGFFFDRSGFAEANIITIYVLAVLVISVVTNHRIYSFFASLASVLIFNFLFTAPKFSLQAYDKGYPLTFLVMFVSALMTGSLAAKLKSSAKQSERSSFRITVLFETNQLLQHAETDEDIFRITANECRQLLGRDILLYPVEEGTIGRPRFFQADTEAGAEDYTTEREMQAVEWTLHHLNHASSATAPITDAKCIYFAIKTGESAAGILGAAVGKQPWDSYENTILLSILGECALALENRKNAREKEAAAVLAKNEQLRANLLRAISHDLRTPLTSISGNASNLLNSGDIFDRETKNQLYQDIYDDSMWLINLVENLLSVTKLEEGRVNLHICGEMVEEVIYEALRHVNRLKSEHIITVECKEEFLMAKMDAKLIVQVIVNLVDNAIKYTQQGSHIKVSAHREGEFVLIKVADDGQGIPDEQKSQVFQMFYTGTNKIGDSRRSLGLGLSLCKSIVGAHGGTLMLTDNQPTGSVFSFTLPVEEVTLHE
ncbi:MAG: DUF4118 domain-containing protein [Eubacteriales bacterium]|nr:DUF4118 domain-containing protein [Eubacteriales bacterium]